MAKEKLTDCSQLRVGQLLLYNNFGIQTTGIVCKIDEFVCSIFWSDISVNKYPFADVQQWIDGNYLTCP